VSFRALRRAVALAFALAGCVLDYWRFRFSGAMTLDRRALWLQRASRRVLTSFGIRPSVTGDIPTRGLIVSNHLSHLDILILSSITPCFFVSKIEVGAWPYFGEAARNGGTIFLNRGNRASADAASAELARRLTLPIPIVLFPEGTTSDGAQVLRFRSRLIEPAIAAAAPVTPAAIRYVAPVPERELCWYGDEPLLPHLWRVLRVSSFRAEVRFGPPQIYPDRRAAAAYTHDAVSAMRDAAQLPGC